MTQDLVYEAYKVFGYAWESNHDTLTADELLHCSCDLCEGMQLLELVIYKKDGSHD